MRRIERLRLSTKAAAYLEKRRRGADRKLAESLLNPETEWKSARKTAAMDEVRSTLGKMAGPRERCMYCLDSHGSDIEHYWPKAPYPKKMFVWENLLLCCSLCGSKYKRSAFPLENGAPLLIDPTAEDPWLHLDFEPLVGKITARWEAAAGGYSRKGEETVALLKLHRREAMATGYRKTWKRLVTALSEAAESGVPPGELLDRLEEADDHGLLGWCFTGTGANEPPFAEFRAGNPEIWNACRALYESRRRTGD